MSIVIGRNRCNKVAKSLINSTYRPYYHNGGCRLPLNELSAIYATGIPRAHSLNSQGYLTIPVRHYSSKAPSPAQGNQTTDKKIITPDTYKTEVTTKKSKPKEPLWDRVKSEVKHYVNGTKLLGYEVKVSMKLLMKFAKGYELSRRETNQLQRTMSDVFRLVPFSAFIIIPFAELLLPIVLKIFPNMLPSTYESGHEKQKKKVRLDEIRQKTSNFLQETLEESQLISYNTLEGTEKRKKFLNFFKKINSPKEGRVDVFSQEEILTIAQMFKNDTVLDNLSRPQLMAMAKYMSLRPFGTDNMLRYQIRHKLKRIIDDDKVIDYEGVESLTMEELYQAAVSRGMKTFGVPREELLEHMNVWLELRLRHKIPSVLLILSSAYTFGGMTNISNNKTERLQQDKGAQRHEELVDFYYDGILQVLSTMPDPVYNVAKLEVSTSRIQKGATPDEQIPPEDGKVEEQPSTAFASKPSSPAEEAPFAAHVNPAGHTDEAAKRIPEEQPEEEETSKSDDNEFKLNVLKEQEEMIRKEEEEAKLRAASDIQDNINLDEEEPLSNSKVDHHKVLESKK